MKAKTILILLFSWSFFGNSILSQQLAKTSEGKQVILNKDNTWHDLSKDSLLTLKPQSIDSLELPEFTKTDVVVHHTGFSLSFNAQHKQANWVCYQLTDIETASVFERTDKFLPDPQIKLKTAKDSDYSKSGYDRGHLAPAGDMAWSLSAMEQSFYYSNISPQLAVFNRGIWKKLETQVRYWADEYRSIYVVTGGVLTSDLETIGTNKISVPKYFYKVLLRYNTKGVSGLGFIIPNTIVIDSIQNYAVTIDSVEALTGLNFFSRLPDEEEKLIESRLYKFSWSWNSGENKPTYHTCKGSNSAGEPCENKSSVGSLYCNHHKSTEDNSSGSGNSTNITNGSTNKTTNTSVKSSGSVQCSGTTQKGARCKRMTTSANGRCYQH